MASLSLRARLLAGVGLVAVLLAVVALVITSTARAQLIDQLDERLAASATADRVGSFDSERAAADPASRDDLRPGPPPPTDRQSDFFEGAILSDGTLLAFFSPTLSVEDYSPPDIDMDDVDADEPGRQYVTVSAQDGPLEYRVLVEVSASSDGAFVTALPLNDVESTIRELTWIVVAAITSVLAVLGLVTWWMLRLGIKPIKAVTTTAVTIAAGDLSARADETATATEPRELAAAVNTMMSTIEQSIAERDESEARLRRFVSDASHELRTPVTTIRGYAELYRIGALTDGAALDDAMRRTGQESERMTRLVEDMLTLAKLDEERPAEQRPVDIAALVRDAVADATAVAGGRSITAVAPDALVITSDDDRIRQVLSNLVNNALVHTDADAAITVSVLRPADGRVSVQVTDEGDGMDAETRDRITERFFRADPSRSRERGGSGLGLAIVDATVESLGGTVRVDSEPGQGTTVTVELPTG